MKLPPNYLYTQMDNDDREILYRQWCREQRLDPDREESVYAFFDAIDRIQDEETEDADISDLG